MMEVELNSVNTLDTDMLPAGPKGQDGITPTIGDNGNWYIGDTDTGLPSRGEKGDAGSVKFIVVTELPTENIDESAIYMKPVADPQGENTYQEYIYVNGAWETLGTASVEVDLSNYPTKEEVKSITGELENLPTEDKSNLVNSIIELAGNSGGAGVPTITEATTLTEYGVYNYKTDTGFSVTLNGGKDAGSSCYVSGEGTMFYIKPAKTTDRGILLVFMSSSATGCALRVYATANQTKTFSLEQLMTTNSDVTVGAKHTYNTLPESSKTPTTDNQLVNKKYVDDAIAALKAELGGQ